MPSRLTPAQVRCARTMLNWSMLDLAEAARIPMLTVQLIEDSGLQSLWIDVRLAVWDAFEDAGVCFPDDGTSVGLRCGPR